MPHVWWKIRRTYCAIAAPKPFRPEPVAAELPDGYRRRADGWIEFASVDENADDGEAWHDLCCAWGRLLRIKNADQRIAGAP